MKRGDVLYPHAFTVLSVIANLDNDASMKQVAETLAESGLMDEPLAGYHQILRHLEKKGFVSRTKSEDAPYGHRSRWTATQDGMDAIGRTRSFYEQALYFYGGETENEEPLQPGV